MLAFRRMNQLRSNRQSLGESEPARSETLTGSAAVVALPTAGALASASGCSIAVFRFSDFPFALSSNFFFFN